MPKILGHPARIVDEPTLLYLQSLDAHLLGLVAAAARVTYCEAQDAREGRLVRATVAEAIERFARPLRHEQEARLVESYRRATGPKKKTGVL